MVSKENVLLLFLQNNKKIRVCAAKKTQARIVDVIASWLGAHPETRQKRCIVRLSRKFSATVKINRKQKHLNITIKTNIEPVH